METGGADRECKGSTVKFVAIIDGEEHPVVIEREGKAFRLEIDGKTVSADLVRANDSLHTLRMSDHRQYAVVHHQHRERHEVFFPNFRVDLDLRDPLSLARGAGSDEPDGDEQTVRAVMPGRVVRVEVAEGDEVEKGKTLVVVEAMKMENAIEAPRTGKVVTLHVQPGSTVESGAELVTIE